MKSLLTLLTLPILLLSSCAHPGAAGFAFRTLKDTPIGTTLSYQGTFTPPLDQRFREKSLTARQQGDTDKADQLQSLIGQRQAVNVTVSRTINTQTSNRVTFSSTVTATEGGSSKTLTRDASHFQALTLPRHNNSAYSLNFGTIPLTPGTDIRSRDSHWEVIGKKSTRTIAGITVTPTLVRHTKKIDDYRRIVTEFLLSEALPGRIAEFTQIQLDHGKSSGEISLKLSSIR